MSFSKFLCVAVAGNVLFSGVASARPDGSAQPPVKTGQKQAGKAAHKHRHGKRAKLRKLLRKHHQKKHARHNTKAPANPR